jgi:hypothetical protein
MIYRVKRKKERKKERKEGRKEERKEGRKAGRKKVSTFIFLQDFMLVSKNILVNGLA